MGSARGPSPHNTHSTISLDPEVHGLPSPAHPSLPAHPSPPPYRRQRPAASPLLSPTPLLLLLLLLGTGWVPLPAPAAAATHPAVKWTFFIYMLADNNLECFGIMDMIEMMKGMAVEPPGLCVSRGCGAECAAGYVATSRTSCGQGLFASRCCPSAPYPDVLLLADRGVSACAFSAPGGGLDTSLLNDTWSTAKELLVMPGGSLQQVRDLGEIDMASPTQLAQFLQGGLARFPPTSDAEAAGVPVRKYALILWDHGNGWKGYGVDDTCTSGAASSGCDQFTLATLLQGLASGLTSLTAAGRKLDIIGFDACLMASYEVAATLAPYSRTLLASQLLEPGHGWDYAALGDMTVTAANGSSALASSNTTTTTVAAAQIWMGRYKAQAVSYGTTGITLALANLGAVSESLMPALSSAATALRSSLAAGNASLASSVLRRRIAMATMGSGEQDSSVDMGSALAELLLADADLDAPSRAALSAAATYYNASILAFTRDDEQSRATGLSLYFPLQASKLDSQYTTLAAASPAGPLTTAAGPWAAFLTQLYNASASIASSGALFAFVSSAGSVPYIDVASGSTVLSGVLSSPLALSATLYYGFVDATKKSYILAGSQPALVSGTSVVGTWRRLLWGLAQTIPTPGAPSPPAATPQPPANTTASLISSSPSSTSGTLPAALLLPSTSTSSGTSAASLIFANEEWTTLDGGATAAAVSITASVRYGATCSTPRVRMSPAILKYTYRFTTGRASLLLFAQQASGAYGEVSSQAGGAVVPFMYKLARDYSSAQTTTYQYSGCIKWGYNGTVRVVPVALESAADRLGVDLQEELLMLLQVKDVSLTKTASLVAPFAQAADADTTRGGCQCLSGWRLTDAASHTTTTSGGSGPTFSGCANPDDDPRGPWCPILPGSCTRPGQALGAINASSSPYDYCAPTRTLSGCSCSSKYGVNPSNSSFAYGTCYRGDQRAESRGAWCTVEPSSCPTPYRAHGSNDTSYDYCETRTVEGCTCAGSWTYNGVTYNGTCARGFAASDSPPLGFSNSSSWCRVRPGCATSSQIGGHRIGLCGPSVSPSAGPSSSPCTLPTTLPGPGGVPVYDCVPWRNGPTASDLLDGVAPICPLDAAASSFDTCNTRNCTALDMSSCPVTEPQSIPVLQGSAWLGASCLSQLCGAVLVAGDAGVCAADVTRATTAFGQLNSSAVATNTLMASYSAVSLSAYCTATHGADCLTATLLPACPAIRLNGTAMYDTATVDDSSTAKLCRTDCLRALCTITGTKCTRSRLVESLRLALLDAMDSRCPTNTTSGVAAFDKPAGQLCAELLAPTASCAAATNITATSGSITLAPVSGTSSYAPLTNCTWRLQPTGGPRYITAALSYFATEPLYDVLRVEDADGVVAVLSGAQGSVPGTLSTDTGTLTLTFTSDGSLQLGGFSLTFNATTTRTVPAPTCTIRQKLAMFTVTTQQYGNEVGWALGAVRVSTASSNTSSTSNTTSTTSSSSASSTQLVVLAAGGVLPNAAYGTFAAISNMSALRVDAQYKNARTYITYACLPVGLSTIYLYDMYGDGWNGGWMTVSYLPYGVSSSSNGYMLVNSTVALLNATTKLMVFANMPDKKDAYTAALASNLGSGTFSTRFTLRLSGETEGAAAVTELKQLLLRGAIAALLSVDHSVVKLESITAVSNTGRRRGLQQHHDQHQHQQQQLHRHQQQHQLGGIVGGGGRRLVQYGREGAEGNVEAEGCSGACCGGADGDAPTGAGVSGVSHYSLSGRDWMGGDVKHQAARQHTQEDEDDHGGGRGQESAPGPTSLRAAEAVARRTAALAHSRSPAAAAGGVSQSDQLATHLESPGGGVRHARGGDDRYVQNIDNNYSNNKSYSKIGAVWSDNMKANNNNNNDNHINKNDNDGDGDTNQSFEMEVPIDSAVVEVLVARAGELGLQVPGRSSQRPSDRTSSAAAAAAAAAAGADQLGGTAGGRQQVKRRRLSVGGGDGGDGDGLQGLLVGGAVADRDIGELVSVTQPHLLTEEEMAEAAAEVVVGVGGGQQQQSSSSGALGAAVGAAGKEAVVGGIGEEAAADSSTNSSSSSSSSFEVGGGFTVLFNGLVVGPDGVPLASKPKPQTTTPPSSPSSPLPPSGADVATTTGNTTNSSSEDVGSTATGSSSRSDSSRSGSSGSGGSEDVLRSWSLGATTQHTSSRGPLPPLVRHLPALDSLTEIERKLQRVPEAGHGGRVGGRGAGGGIGNVRSRSVSTAAGGGPDGQDQGSLRRVGGGARSAVPLLHVLLPEVLQQGAKQLAKIAAVTCTIPPPAAHDPDTTQSLMDSATAGGLPGQEVAAGGSVHHDAGQQSGPQRRRRRLQQSSSSSPLGVDVVVEVVGYASRAEAEVAGAKVAVAAGGDLTDLLGDAGWSAAAASLVGTPQVLQNGQSASSSGTNWTMIIIIAAAVGGAVVLVALAAIMWRLSARKKDTEATKQPQPKKAGTKAGAGGKVPPAEAVGTGAAGGADRTAASQDVLALAKTKYEQRLLEEKMAAGSSAAASSTNGTSGSSQIASVQQLQQQQQLQNQQQQMMLMQQMQTQPEEQQAVAAQWAHHRQEQQLQQRMQQQQLQQRQSMIVANADAGQGRAGHMPQLGGGPNGQPSRPPMGGWMAAQGSEFEGPLQSTQRISATTWNNPMQEATAVAAMYEQAPMGQQRSQAMMQQQMMDPYGMYLDPYGMMYDAYGMYGDPYYGSYPPPPAAWGGAPGQQRRSGWM